MDGTFAVLTLLAGFADISISDCKPNCYAESQVPQRISISAGQVYYQLDQVDTEVYVRKQTGRAYGPWRMVSGASATQRRDYWAGVGILYEAASKTRADLCAASPDVWALCTRRRRGSGRPY